MNAGTKTKADAPSDGRKPEAPTNPNLVRDRLANERTFLAWLRTAIAIISLGFVVARFDIFLRELARASGQVNQEVGRSALTVPLGVLLVLAGPVIIVVAALRYLHTEWALLEGRLDSHRLIRNIIVAIALGSVLAGVGLAVHLLATWPR
jgi:putative membrane protein